MDDEQLKMLQQLDNFLLIGSQGEIGVFDSTKGSNPEDHIRLMAGYLTTVVNLLYEQCQDKSLTECCENVASLIREELYDSFETNKFHIKVD